MAAGKEICAMNAVQLADAVRARRLSPVEVIDAILERMNRVEPHLHAFCTPTPELARAEAKRIEAEISAGRDAGPLAGVPVHIKDLIFTRGIRTTSGSVAYRNFTPDEDDIAVERLRAAGAIIIGKTNTAEFGYSATGHNPLFETTRNPWNLAMTPGGSSAGAGAAVAAGVAPLALGSDGGGSVRIPASFCGLYGIKPSFGRIPLYPGSRDERYPGASGWESIECYGPLARTVADAALMLSAIIGPDPRDRQSRPSEGIDWRGCARAGDLRGKRVAYSADWGYAAVDPEVAQIAHDAARVFERDLGCSVEEVNPGWSDPAMVFAATMVAETDLRGMRKMIAEHGAQMSSHMVDLINAAVERRGIDRREHRTQDPRQSHGALHGEIRSAADADDVRAAISNSDAGARQDCRALRAARKFSRVYDYRESDRSARCDRTRWIYQRRTAGRPADHRTSSRRRDGAAGVGGVRGRMPVGASMATAPGAAVSLIANGAPLLLDLLEPSRKRRAHPRDALRIGSRKIILLHRIVFDVEQLQRAARRRACARESASDRSP